MGHNVQSQAGESLTDIYDVRGGQAPVERILTADVQAVHGMAETIASERFSITIRRAVSIDDAQNIVFNEVLTDLPSGVSRVLGVQVFANAIGRTSIASVMARDPTSGREFPLFLWDSDTDIFKQARMEDDGAGVGTHNMLIQIEPQPLGRSILAGSAQPQSVGQIALRGIASGFGAGTVTHVMIIHLAFSAIGGISSHGLPIPSW